MTSYLHSTEREFVMASISERENRENGQSEACITRESVVAAWASPPGTAWAYGSSVVETRRWSSRRETITIGTPAWRISVAMKWRRSCNRNGRSPAARRCRKNAFGDPVRLPRRLTTVVAKHERVRLSPNATLGGKINEHVDGRRIKIDDVTTFGLGSGVHRPVGSFDSASGGRRPSGGEVHVVPAKAELLSAAGAAGGSDTSRAWSCGSRSAT
jgi:hypothetical protein